MRLSSNEVESRNHCTQLTVKLPPLTLNSGSVPGWTYDFQKRRMRYCCDYVCQDFCTTQCLWDQPLEILLAFYVKLRHKTTTTKSCCGKVSDKLGICAPKKSHVRLVQLDWSCARVVLVSFTRYYVSTSRSGICLVLVPSILHSEFFKLVADFKPPFEVFPV